MNVPRRPDEVALWAEVAAGRRPRAAGLQLGIPHGRVLYLCEKWGRLGIFTWGVTADLGWATDRVDPRGRP